MFYVKGFFMRKVGEFEAKVKFEGIVKAKDVEDNSSHVIIQGYYFTKEQITMLQPVMSGRPNLNLATVRGETPKHKTAELKAISSRVAVNLGRIAHAMNTHDALMAKTRRYKRIVPAHYNYDLPKEVEFLKTVARSAALRGDDKVALANIDTAVRLIQKQTGVLSNAKTAKQMVKELA